MSGWTKYSLENNYSNDKLQGTLHGIEMSIAFYQKNKSKFGRIKLMEKFIKLKKKGKLEKYVASKLK